MILFYCTINKKIPHIFPISKGFAIRNNTQPIKD